MGNRCYLYLKNPKKELPLFEANNSLPFFWIAILDKKILIDKIQQWKAYEQYAEKHTEEETELYLKQYSNNLSLDQETFTRNAKRTQEFLTENFSETLPLFNDFVKFIHSKFETDDRLEIDITQFSAFYDSLEEFFLDLTSEMDAIENNQAANIKFLLPNDLIAAGTGFQSISGNEFSTLPTYTNAIQNRGIPQQPFSRKSLIVAITILMICPLFSYWAYRIYTKDGFNTWVIIIGFLNMLFYLYSISTIILEIKAYRKNPQ
ncbi:hypothetical protein SAMN05421594_2603 [Chryseobacterium oleae]|uniref:Uncharacterized protein n=1 Tax=Chryseobacterium oleae TaxID=491207 RepID=A0A1I4YRH9_CHROL|nr:hypothetical protein [Chryseobacterium oleae]SFN40249.1 hypothetical protein SAMN05421594_2603 [Chryseobacterium oleae]